MASALGLALGAVRGRAVVVFERDGHLWQRYTGGTFVYVVGTFLAMAAFDLAAAALGMAPDARPVQSALGVGFLGEAPAVGHRALAESTPSSPNATEPLPAFSPGVRDGRSRAPGGEKKTGPHTRARAGRGDAGQGLPVGGPSARRPPS
ncbi:hypothetical protein ACOQFV_29710 [Nocardiopsis changdeensis]|uniref:Uncharacterized protein n=1 Tax=Nocardiopsis changdeensis TaxID=2831969 RepID=A0ABX8BSG4_9ACTN|nr:MULTISPECIES: hypothetical protein [Nocardiopsis]QUX25001.1 hypothetical protein KGD84_12490 [Nocardiopsis changdeensis]QYX35388.1 hypothetical protein K1J57_21940 [Nocardiopsis sp. MT53]